jgi:hypothetical protein
VPLPGLAALLPLLVAGEVEVSAGASAELRAGVSPYYAGAESARFAAAFVIPTLAVQHRDLTSESFVQYLPRLFWRDPPGLARRPLVLHTWNLAHRARPTRRGEWRLQLDGTYGDVDYSALGQLLTTQTAITQTRRILVLAGSAGGAWQADRRTRLELDLRYQYRKSYGEFAAGSASSSPTLLPEQHSLTLEPRTTTRTSRTEQVSVQSWVVLYVAKRSTADGGTAYFSTLVWQPQVQWRATGRSHEASARAGVAVAPRLSDSGGTQAWMSLWPVGELGLSWLLHRVRDLEVRSELLASSSWYYDSVLDAGIPRGAASASVGARRVRGWQANLVASFSTNLTRQPLAGNPDETMMAVLLSARFPITPEWSLEAGLRWSERAPHLQAAGFALRNHEFYGYARLVFLFREGLVGMRPQPQR